LIIGVWEWKITLIPLTLRIIGLEPLRGCRRKSLHKADEPDAKKLNLATQKLRAKTMKYTKVARVESGASWADDLYS